MVLLLRKNVYTHTLSLSLFFSLLHFFSSSQFDIESKTRRGERQHQHTSHRKISHSLSLVVLLSKYLFRYIFDYADQPEKNRDLPRLNLIVLYFDDVIVCFQKLRARALFFSFSLSFVKLLFYFFGNETNTPFSSSILSSKITFIKPLEILILH